MILSCEIKPNDKLRETIRPDRKQSMPRHEYHPGDLSRPMITSGNGFRSRTFYLPNLRGAKHATSHLYPLTPPQMTSGFCKDRVFDDQ